MKEAIVILAMLLSIANCSFAKEYGEYDPKRVVTVTETVSGERYGLDLQYLDKIVGDLSVHAKNYPPKFDSEADRQRAINDTKLLSGMLDSLVSDSDTSVEILKRSSQLNSIGHNLGIQGSAQRADRDFQKLLKQQPDDPAVNFAYGAFLGGSNQGARALPYLKKSANAGYVSAYYALGIAYLAQNDIELSLENFEKYQELRPNDKSAAGIIDTIKNGSIEFKSN